MSNGIIEIRHEEAEGRLEKWQARMRVISAIYNRVLIATRLIRYRLLLQYEVAAYRCIYKI